MVDVFYHSNINMKHTTLFHGLVIWNSLPCDKHLYINQNIQNKASRLIYLQIKPAFTNPQSPKRNLKNQMTFVMLVQIYQHLDIRNPEHFYHCSNPLPPPLPLPRHPPPSNPVGSLDTVNLGKINIQTYRLCTMHYTLHQNPRAINTCTYDSEWNQEFFSICRKIPKKYWFISYILLLKTGIFTGWNSRKSGFPDFWRYFRNKNWDSPNKTRMVCRYICVTGQEEFHIYTRMRHFTSKGNIKNDNYWNITICFAKFLSHVSTLWHLFLLWGADWQQVFLKLHYFVNLPWQ